MLVLEVSNRTGTLALYILYRSSGDIFYSFSSYINLEVADLLDFADCLAIYQPLKTFPMLEIFLITVFFTLSICKKSGPFCDGLHLLRNLEVQRINSSQSKGLQRLNSSESLRALNERML